MSFASGSYEGRSQLYAFQVRFDLADNTGAGFNQISGDFYEGAAVDPRRFYASFASTHAPLISGDGRRLEAPLAVRGPSHEPWTANGTLVCERQPDGSLQTVIELSTVLDGVYARYELRLERRSEFFRTVAYQLDLFGAPAEMQQVGPLYETVRAHLRRAGIEMLGNAAGRIIGDNPESAWSEADLFNALSRSGFFGPEHPANALAWRVYLMVVPRFRNAGDTGWMFDEGQDASPRQAAAVSWRAYGDPSGPDFARNFIRTFTHEVGHTFNLLHTFDSRKLWGPRRGSASFMNYPQEYAVASGPGGPDAYWRAFQEQNSFDPDELVFLRHSHLETVIMGGASLGTGGHDRAATDLAPPTATEGLRLELRLTPNGRPPRLEFGEPVHLEAKLVNRSGEERLVADVLDPAHRRTHYFIRRPDGSIVCYQALLTRCGGGRAVVLSPERRPALYENVALSYGVRDFYFLEPGRYQVQAVYTATATPLRSNVLDLWVRYPDRATEDLVVPTLTSNVAAYLATWGNLGLPEAEAKLRDFTEAATRGRTAAAPHPLAAEFCRCAFYARVRGHRQLHDDPHEAELTFTVTPPRPDLALDELRRGLKLPARRPFAALNRRLPRLSNILFGHLAGSIMDALQRLGDVNAVQRVAGVLADRLEQQGAPPSVKRRYQQRWNLDESRES